MMTLIDGHPYSKYLDPPLLQEDHKQRNFGRTPIKQYRQKVSYMIRVWFHSNTKRINTHYT